MIAVGYLGYMIAALKYSITDFATLDDLVSAFDAEIITTDPESKCPPVVRNNAGLFAPTSTSPLKDKFANTVLLVSSNYQYLDILQNWEYLATQLGLQWVVLALDDDLYQALGPERALAPNATFAVSGSHKFRTSGFNTMSCNKLRMVRSVLQDCQYNVLFSDCDNIFFENPLEHDLGKLILSNQYDYLYQNNGKAAGTSPRNDSCLFGEKPREGNTGFYYLSASSDILRLIYRGTLTLCERPNNQWDDQKLFWKVLNTNRKKKKEHVYQHCNLRDDPNLLEKDLDAFQGQIRNEATQLGVTDDQTLQDNMTEGIHYCCLDPYYYPTGMGFSNPKPITYHGNWVKGKDKKIERLQSRRKDGYGWNASRIQLPTLE